MRFNYLQVKLTNCDWGESRVGNGLSKTFIGNPCLFSKKVSADLYEIDHGDFFNLIRGGFGE